MLAFQYLSCCSTTRTRRVAQLHDIKANLLRPKSPGMEIKKSPACISNSAVHNT